MFFGSIKGTNRLINIRMSNIYLKVTTEKNGHSQNFYFLSLKNLSPGQFLGSSNSHLFQFWKESWCIKLKKVCILLNKIINFDKNETELKMENPIQFLRDKPCASAHIRIRN